MAGFAVILWQFCAIYISIQYDFITIIQFQNIDKFWLFSLSSQHSKPFDSTSKQEPFSAGPEVPDCWLFCLSFLFLSVWPTPNIRKPSFHLWAVGPILKTFTVCSSNCSIFLRTKLIYNSVCYLVDDMDLIFKKLNN